MKKNVLFNLLFLGVFATSVNAYSAPVDYISAAKKASEVLGGKEVVSSDGGSYAKVRGNDVVSSPLYYAFNAKDGDGFVLVCGDDDESSVLGYSNNGTFNADSLPAGLSDFLKAYANRSDENGVRKSAVRKAFSYAPVDSLCTTLWHQTYPYNYYAPMVGKEVCVVGCVATAMSQIMKYWEWPAQGRGEVSYASSGVGVMSRDFSESYYNWSVMTNKSGRRVSDASRDAMSRLCIDAGYSVKMQYGTSSTGGSGAFSFNALTAFVRNFSYDGSSIKIIWRDCFSDDDEWLDVLYKEFTARRPVYYSGNNSDGTGGHAFIIDGMDKDGLLHVNWGWGGSCNGYYDLTLAPSGDDFSYDNAAIVGIAPDYNGTKSKAPQIGVKMNAPSCSGVVPLGSYFQFTLSKVINASSLARTITFAPGLYDENGNFITILDNDCTPRSFHGFTGVTSGTFDVEAEKVLNCVFPADCKDGKYGIRCLQKEDGYDEWVLPNVVGGGSLNWIPVVVRNGKAELNSPDGPTSVTSIDDEEVISRDYFTLSGVKVSAPKSGDIFIERSTYSDGSVKTRKVVK